MNSIIFWIIGFTALGGVLSVLAAGGLLLLPEPARTRLLPPLVSFAIGALLGAAFLALLPGAVAGFGLARLQTLALTVLLGLLGFFILEKMVIWRHCHIHDCEAHGGANAPRDRMSEGAEAHGGANAAGSSGFSPSVIEAAQHAAAGKLILIGDGIHNLVDGVLIAAAFLTDIHLGIVTSVAVIAHEIPQEVGDFAILLNSGYSRAQALWYNIATSLTTIVGGVIAYFSFAHAQMALPYVLAIAASSFIYIAVADLIPGLHKRVGVKATVQQVLLIAAGIAVISVTQEIFH